MRVQRTGLVPALGLAVTLLALAWPHPRAGSVMGTPEAVAKSTGEAGKGAAAERSAPARGADGTAAAARKYIRYDRTVFLTADQEALRSRALTPLPAPCCSAFSMATCCCQCNLSRSIWGLSKLEASRTGATEQSIRDAVMAWVAEINPRGYSGETCQTGGCGLPFERGGCGGMDEKDLAVR